MRGDGAGPSLFFLRKALHEDFPACRCRGEDEFLFRNLCMRKDLQL